MKPQVRWAWLWGGLGLALGHWGLSCYAFAHYKTALEYFIRPFELLFEYTLALPQCLERQIPPNLSAVTWMMPVQSVVLAAVYMLLLFALREVRFRPGAVVTVLARVGMVVLTTLCVCIGFSVTILILSIYMNFERPMVSLKSDQFPTLEAKTAWLNRLQPLPGRVLDTRYALQACVYSHGVRIVHFDIATKIPPSEMNRWLKLTWGTFTPVKTDPRTKMDFDNLMPWPANAQWRHTSTPEYYEDDAAFIIFYRREGIVFLHRTDGY